MNSSDRDLKSYRDGTSRGFLDYALGRIDSPQTMTDYEAYLNESSD